MRALYNDTGSTDIGLNPLTSAEPIWYAGPDLAASKLVRGRTPKIIKAFKLVPTGVQEGVKPTVIGTRALNPEKHDFFRVVLEERRKLPKSHPHYLLVKNSRQGVVRSLRRVEQIRIWEKLR